MTTESRSRYRAGAEPDYSHRFHAGNVGDVWKHCVLAELLMRVSTTAARITYIETHAGEGTYALGSTGEWTEGIGRLWSCEPPSLDSDAVAGFVRLVRDLGAGAERPRHYPGSPMIARAVLGPTARLELSERDPATARRLRATVDVSELTRVHEEDGLATLRDRIAEADSRSDEVIVVIDPAWTQKADWIAVPDALAAAVATSMRARFLLWYPVKSLTRPNAMIARLAAGGVPATIAELITTPLGHQRQRLNGSGVLLVRPPAGVLPAIAAAAPVLGHLCATRAGVWSFRAQEIGR